MQAAIQLMQQEFITPFLNNKPKHDIDALRQCAWTEFFGYQSNVNLDELRTLIKEYLPKTFIMYHIVETAELVDIRDQEIAKALETLELTNKRKRE